MEYVDFLVKQAPKPQSYLVRNSEPTQTVTKVRANNVAQNNSFKTEYMTLEMWYNEQTQSSNNVVD